MLAASCPAPRSVVSSPASYGLRAVRGGWCPRRPTGISRRGRWWRQRLELRHDLPSAPHGNLRPRHRAVELVVVVGAVARAAQLPHAVAKRAVERARALEIVRDHPLMGVAGGRQPQSLLVAGARASRPIHRIIGAT